MTGILTVDKPKDFTSFDLVAKCRRLCGEKRCGHSGTLDPMATGVMNLLFGGATRFCELLPDHNKAYVAKLKLGTVTDTLDITGKVLEERPFSVSAEGFAAAAESFKGEITQIPPMYSAVSVGGQRLYTLARQGIEVDRPERAVTVYSLDIISADEKAGEYGISVCCSSGTYIRTLISDIGEKLGCGAVMTDLRRTLANGFSIENAVTLENLEKVCIEGGISSLILPVEKVLEPYEPITVTALQAKRFANGGGLAVERINWSGENGLKRVYSPEGEFLGIGEIDGSEDMAVKRVYREI